MNIVLLVFSCLCVLYSAGVLIYLTRKRKTGSQQPPRRANRNTNSVGADARPSNTSNSHPTNFRSNRLHPHDSLQPSHFANSTKYNKNNFKRSKDRSRPEHRIGELSERNLGFSQVHLSKPATHVNGILKNGASRSRRKLKFWLNLNYPIQRQRKWVATLIFEPEILFNKKKTETNWERRILSNSVDSRIIGQKNWTRKTVARGKRTCCLRRSGTRKIGPRT